MTEKIPQRQENERGKTSIYTTTRLFSCGPFMESNTSHIKFEGKNCPETLSLKVLFPLEDWKSSALAGPRQMLRNSKTEEPEERQLDHLSSYKSRKMIYLILKVAISSFCRFSGKRLKETCPVEAVELFGCCCSRRWDKSVKYLNKSPGFCVYLMFKEHKRFGSCQM